MARQPENFSIENQLSTAAETLYTPSNTNEIGTIRKLSFYNSGSSTRLVTVYVVASGSSAGTTNILVQRSIPPLKTWNCLEARDEVIKYGQSLQAVQDAGTDVNANGGCSLFL